MSLKKRIDPLIYELELSASKGEINLVREILREAEIVTVLEYEPKTSEKFQKLFKTYEKKLEKTKPDQAYSTIIELKLKMI